MKNLFYIVRLLFLFGAGFFCAALIFEGALRLIEATPAWRVLPVAEVSVYGVDDKASYSHRKNVSGIWATENRAKVSINSLGFRSNGTALKAEKPAQNVFKVGLVGDSMTEALQVADNQTFSALIEKNLQSQGYDIAVYNLGLAGATPAIEAIRARQFAQSLDLDLIIIIDDPYSLTHKINRSVGGTLPHYKLSEENDVVIAHPYLNSRSYKFKQSSIGKGVYFLIEHSRLVSVLNNRLNRGFFDELMSQLKLNKASSTENKKECGEESLSVLARLYNKEKSKNTKFLKAFFQDLSKIQKEQQTKIILAMHDSWLDCSMTLEVSAYANISRLAQDHSLGFLNLKKELKNQMLQGEDIKNLRGFGVKQGAGHLNHHGHQAFSDVLSAHILEKQKSF